MSKRTPGVSDEAAEAGRILANKSRSRRILKALRTQYGVSSTKGDLRAMIVDAMADLRHLCDTKGFNFTDLDTSASNHYSCEVIDKELSDLVTDYIGGK